MVDYVYWGMTVSEWVEDLGDGNAQVRWRAARTLGLIGAPAKVALASLLEALSDEDIWVRTQVAWAIQQLKNA